MKKVLVIRLSSLGDVILSTAVIQPLWEKGYNVDFLTFKPFDEIFKNDYRLNRVLGVEKEKLKSITDIVSFSKKLDKYDYIIDIHKNLRTFIISLFAKGKTVRYKKEAVRRRIGRLNREFNVVYAYLNTLTSIGINNPHIYRPKVIISNQEKESIKKMLPEKFISIGTGARYKNKIYPFYNKVADLLIEKGYNIVLVGSSEDKSMDRNIYNENVIDLRGKLTLRESLSVISSGILTISNDSAVAHMSRATGVPVLMIYGATHPYLGFAPLKDEGEYIFKNLPCQPCDIHGKGECKRSDIACLTTIEPKEIVERALKLIR